MRVHAQTASDDDDVIYFQYDSSTPLSEHKETQNRAYILRTRFTEKHIIIIED
jgi:hypothetical protein